MSLITQCPACATMFRVVPDQLRISEGWVRCGQCDEVFDANAHLRTLDERPSLSAQSSPAEPQPVAPPAPVGEPQFDLPAVEFAALESQPSLEPDAFLQQNPHAMPLEQEQLLVQEPVSRVEQALQADLPTPYAFSLPAQEMATEAAQAPPSFMQSAESGSQATSRVAASILLVLGVLLALLLPLQFLLQNRDRLASTAPLLRPLLEIACEWLACSISAPQQIEAIAIESSSFTSVKSGVYVLSVTLKNAAPIELATPALELTLTDRQDQTIVRRVLLPQEWGGGARMQAGSEASASLPITAREDAVPRISGYKLLAFYP